jgi:hypothetical protein
VPSSVNYRNTFITAADDCPVGQGAVPPDRAGQPTVAGAQFAMLHAHPYRFTSEDVIFETSSARRALGPDVSTKALADERARFFARPQACLRASPLPKRFGWGVHCDDQGRVAIFGIESNEYAELSHRASLDQRQAMRSRRPGKK